MEFLKQEKETKQLTGHKEKPMTLPLRKRERKSVSVFKILFCAFLLFFFLFCARIAILEIVGKDFAATVSAFLIRQGLGMSN